MKRIGNKCFEFESINNTESVIENLKELEFIGESRNYINQLLTYSQYLNDPKDLVALAKSGNLQNHKKIFVPEPDKVKELIDCIKEDAIFDLLEDCAKNLSSEGTNFMLDIDGFTNHCKEFYPQEDSFIKNLKRYCGDYKVEKIIFPLYMEIISDTTNNKTDKKKTIATGIEKLPIAEKEPRGTISGIRDLPKILHLKYIDAKVPRKGSENAEEIEKEIKNYRQLLIYLDKNSSEYLNKSLCIYLYNKYSHMCTMMEILQRHIEVSCGKGTDRDPVKIDKNEFSSYCWRMFKISNKNTKIESSIVSDKLYKIAKIKYYRTSKFLFDYYFDNDITPPKRIKQLDWLMVSIKEYILHKIGKKTINTIYEAIYNELKAYESIHIPLAMKTLENIDLSKYYRKYCELRHAVYSETQKTR